MPTRQANYDARAIIQLIERAGVDEIFPTTLALPGKGGKVVEQVTQTLDPTLTPTPGPGPDTRGAKWSGAAPLPRPARL